MKRLFTLAFLFLWLVNNTFAAPLIFKGRRVITDNNTHQFVDLVQVDVSKYKTIRVGVKYEKPKEVPRLPVSIRITGIEEGETIFIDSFFVGKDSPSETNSKTFDNLPNKIMIQGDQDGAYTIYVWGIQ